MNSKMCASSNKAMCWEDIDFDHAKAAVKKLQRRIYAACAQGKTDKVVTLTNLMLHSFYAKACAVKHVCSTNGKHTPGIDRVLWLSNTDKFNAIFSLKLRGYKPKSLKRVYIQKSGNKRRPLGIPTIKDRAMQTLYRFALEPVAEYYADEQSYGYRQGRSVTDAILHLTNDLSENPKCEWILKADIEGCFDNISHDWLLRYIYINPKLLKKYLKSGFIENRIWHSTEKGVPQGGSVSSVICNLTLDGLADICNDAHYMRNNQYAMNDICMDDISIDIIRYTDDFIIICDDRAVLVREVIPAIEKFLKKRGLKLSQEKTRIININDGITFLGWKIFKKNENIKRIPTQESKNRLFEKIKVVLNQNHISEKEKAKRLKQIITGWLNFYSIATYPFFLNIEYELIMFINQFAGMRYLAGVIHQIFEKFER